MIRNLKITFVVTAVLFFVAMAGLAKAETTTLKVGQGVEISGDFLAADAFIIYTGDTDFSLVVCKECQGAYTVNFEDMEQDYEYKMFNGYDFSFERLSRRAVKVTYK